MTRSPIAMVGTSAHPVASSGKIRHQIREKVEGCSTTFVATHSSVHVKVFGRRPLKNLSTRTGAGVRKPSHERTKPRVGTVMVRRTRLWGIRRGPRL